MTGRSATKRKEGSFGSPPFFEDRGDVYFRWGDPRSVVADRALAAEAAAVFLDDLPQLEEITIGLASAG